MKFRALISLLSLLVFTAVFGYGSTAVAQVQYVPDTDSRVWIEGRSNVNQFTCESLSYEGEATLYEDALEEGEEIASRDEYASIRIEIDVFDLECGRGRMNRDLRDALRAEEFPKITFIFGNVLDMSAAAQDESHSSPLAMQLEINGSLSVAGTTRDIQVKLVGYFLEDGRLRAVGSKSILMTDFNVEPPVALMGLVRAEDELTVHFDLIAKRE